MNPNAQGRVKRPIELNLLRKHINAVGKELKELEGFEQSSGSSQQYMHFEKREMLVSIEFAEEDLKYCCVIVNGGRTRARHFVENKEQLDLFVRDLRKCVRYDVY